VAKKWSDLSARQKQAIVVSGALESVAKAAALRDLARRPSAAVRGSKTAWVLASLVQPVGPIAYLLLGRRDRPT
jgi:hypothetical protein